MNVSQRAGMPSVRAVRLGLALGAALSFAVLGVATAQNDTLQTTPVPQGQTSLQTTPVAQGQTSLQTTPVAQGQTSLQTTPVTSSANPTPVSFATTPVTSDAARAAATVTVTIKEMQFSPASLNVRAGDTVVWMNSDSVAHTATSASMLWDTDSLAPGQSSYFTFNQSGMFAYFCTIHPRMRGAITVDPPAATARRSPDSYVMGPGAFDGGYQMGFGNVSHSSRATGGAPMSYYYNPLTGNYEAAAYPGYPFDKGYGLNYMIYGGGQSSIYGSPYSSYASAYPYSYFANYPYGMYGGYPGYPYGRNSTYGYPYSYVYGSLYSPSFYSYTGYNQFSTYGAFGYPYSYGTPYSYYTYTNPYTSYLYGPSYAAYNAANPYQYLTNLLSGYNYGYYGNYGGVYGYPFMGYPYIY